MLIVHALARSPARHGRLRPILGTPWKFKRYGRSGLPVSELFPHVARHVDGICFGDLGIAALPFETFVEIGLELKGKSPLQPTFVIELANGAEKYLPTPEQHALGGYETWLGTNQVEKQAAVKVSQALLDLLASVAPNRP